jgi:hypothetical protein
MVATDKLFFEVYLGAVGTVGLVALTGRRMLAGCTNVAAQVICRLRPNWYPKATALARLIRDEPEAWEMSSSQIMMTHKVSKQMTLWVANGEHLLHLKTPFARWEPGRIERRIIWHEVERWREAHLAALLATEVEAAGRRVDAKVFEIVAGGRTDTDRVA